MFHFAAWPSFFGSAFGNRTNRRGSFGFQHPSFSGSACSRKARCISYFFTPLCFLWFGVQKMCEFSFIPSIWPESYLFSVSLRHGPSLLLKLQTLIWRC